MRGIRTRDNIINTKFDFYSKYNTNQITKSFVSISFELKFKMYSLI
jgi:hypothetical protein